MINFHKKNLFSLLKSTPKSLKVAYLVLPGINSLVNNINLLISSFFNIALKLVKFLFSFTFYLLFSLINILFQFIILTILLPYLLYRLLLLEKEDGTNPVSVFFRKVFEYEKIKPILGFNLGVFMILVNTVNTNNYSINGSSSEFIFEEKNTQIHTNTTLIKPIDGHITKGYFWGHWAIDIVNELGTPIHPINEGRVIEVSYGDGGYGNKIVVQHDLGRTSLYAHLKIINVSVGDQVQRQTILGYVGLTGWTTGPHLHLEIWEDGVPINPITVLPAYDK